jgi:transcriptional regulator with XRE-family HTH domain
MPKQPETTVTAISDAVAERIREIRRRRGLSVAELAQAAADAGHRELTRDAIYAIESGRRVQGRRRRTVSVDELDAFARVLGVPPTELLGLEERVASGRELLTWLRDGFVVEDLGGGRLAVHRPPRGRWFTVPQPLRQEPEEEGE